MGKRGVLFLLMCLAFMPGLYAELFWDGRFYEQALFSFRSEQGKIRTVYLGFSLLDLKLDAKPSETVRVKSELEYALPHQKNNPFLSSEDLNAVNVNTLNAVISPGDFKFTVGRFLPSWGKGKVFRPLDLFTPQLYFLNMLSFQGIDAVSAKYYISALSSVEFIAVPSMDTRFLVPRIDFSSNSSVSNTGTHTTAAMNMEIHIGSFDNNLILLRDTSSGNNLIGVAFKGDAVIGLWSELFYAFDTKHGLFKGSLGADYSFAKYFFVTAEYFYDESGTGDYRKYDRLRSLLPRMTLGRQYLMLDFNILTYAEMNFGVTWLGNLLEGSFVIFPYYRCEIMENSFLGLSVYHFNGRSGREFSPGLYGAYIFNTYLAVRF